MCTLMRRPPSSPPSESHRPSRRRFLAGSIGAVAWGLSGCERESNIVEVDLNRTLPSVESAATPALHLAVGTRISPRETLQSYGLLTAWLGQRVGRRVVLIQRKTYAETNDLLSRGEADVAFVCTGAYGVLRKRGAALLVVPVVGGKTTYRSLVLVREGDPAATFDDLRGGAVAFVDLLSLTGRMYPESLALERADDGGRFFGATTYTHSHTDSIAMVKEGRVRAAGVDSLVFEGLKRSEPDKAAGLRVLVESEPFGVPPFVSRPGLDPALRDAIRGALLAMHEDEAGTRALSAFGFDKLVAGEESAYETACALVGRFTGSGEGP